MDDDRAAPRLDDRRPFEAHLGLEQLADVDVRLADALERIVDAPPALARVDKAPPGRRHRRGSELADLSSRDYVRRDELDRRVEPVRVLALVRRVERVRDRADVALPQRHLDAV